MFVAEAETINISWPCEVAVICHVAVAVPVDKVPMLKFGVFTEKYPF